MWKQEYIDRVNGEPYAYSTTFTVRSQSPWLTTRSSTTMAGPRGAELPGGPPYWSHSLEATKAWGIASFYAYCALDDDNKAHLVEILYDEISSYAEIEHGWGKNSQEHVKHSLIESALQFLERYAPQYVSEQASRDKNKREPL